MNEKEKQAQHLLPTHFTFFFLVAHYDSAHALSHSVDNHTQLTTKKSTKQKATRRSHGKEVLQCGLIVFLCCAVCASSLNHSGSFIFSFIRPAFHNLVFFCRNNDKESATEVFLSIPSPRLDRSSLDDSFCPGGTIGLCILLPPLGGWMDGRSQAKQGSLLSSQTKT